MDKRYEDMRRRLSLLSSSQLYNILSANADEVCHDTFNYDIATQRYCPLAIALEIPKRVKEARLIPSQELVSDMLKVYGGEAFGTVKGIEGNFYTVDREADLKSLCKEILDERSESYESKQ